MRWRVAATLFFVFSFFIGGFSYFSHTLIESHDAEETRTYLQHLVKVSAETLDLDAYEKLVHIIQAKDLTINEKIDITKLPEYRIIQKQLEFIRSIQPDLYNSIYTIIPTGNPNRVRFVVNVDTLKDMKQIDKRPDWMTWIVFPGNTYDISDQPTTKRAISERVNIVDTEVRYDPTWSKHSLMGLAPIFDPKSHEFLGALGIDLYADNIDKKDQHVHSALNAMTAIVIAFAFIVAILFTRNILQVRKLMEAKQTLEESYEKLRELDEKKSEFLNIASHELRTPRTSVKGYSSMLLDGDAGELPEEAREYVRIIFNQSKRLVRLINDMLDISKIEAQKAEEFVEFPTDIKKAFWQIHDDFLSIANEKHISLIWDIDILDDTIIMLPADRYRQAIINLLGNALKFTPEKGTVTLRAFVRKKSLIVAVSDTGPGIAEKDYGVIFEKF